MSVSNTRLLDFAKHIETNKDVLDAVKERIELKLFARFRSATADERVIINSIMDNDGMFYKEINVILGENEKIESNEIQLVS